MILIATNVGSIFSFMGSTAGYTGNVSVNSGIMEISNAATFSGSNIALQSTGTLRLANTTGTSATITGNGTIATATYANSYSLTGDLRGFIGSYSLAQNSILRLSGQFADSLNITSYSGAIVELVGAAGEAKRNLTITSASSGASIYLYGNSATINSSAGALYTHLG